MLKTTQNKCISKPNQKTKLHAFSVTSANQAEKLRIAQCPGLNPRITTLSPPGLDLSMSAAVQGPPPGLAPHGLPPPGPAMAALMGGPPPLQHLGSRPPPPPPPPPPQHLHRPLDPGEVPGPPNPDVLLALLSRNKTLEGIVLWQNSEISLQI